MADFEVHLSEGEGTRLIGRARSNRARGKETVLFDGLNPVPTDLKARVLSTNIDLDEGTCSTDLLEASAGYFALSLSDARAILKEVARATSTWRTVAKEVRAASSEIHRMASAFEHDSLRQALAMS